MTRVAVTSECVNSSSLSQQIRDLIVKGHPNATIVELTGAKPELVRSRRSQMGMGVKPKPKPAMTEEQCRYLALRLYDYRRGVQL